MAGKIEADISKFMGKGENTILVANNNPQTSSTTLASSPLLSKMAPESGSNTNPRKANNKPYHARALFNRTSSAKERITIMQSRR